MRIFLFIVVLGFLVWLARVPAPNVSKIENINTALESVELDADLFLAFREQAIWIARNAGITEVFLDQSIDENRLDIVVSESRFKDLTRCGKANAIYDPNLKAIFVDKYLLDPVDLNYVGEDGPSVMYDSTDRGFWQTGLSFIIAHELAHYLHNDEASPFFALEWLTSSPDNVDAELAADDRAIRILRVAYEDPAMPEILKEDNSTEAFGLNIVELKGTDYVAADLLGAMKYMTLFMQFLSGPYSPFFSDSTHPNFLERVTRGISNLPTSDTSVVAGQSPILKEEISRLQQMSENVVTEVIFPYPPARVNISDTSVLVGTRSFVALPSDVNQLRIYEFDITNIKKEPFKLVKEKEENEGDFDNLEAWFDEMFPMLSGDVHHGYQRTASSYLRNSFVESQEFIDGPNISGYGWFVSWKNKRLVLDVTETNENIAAYFSERVEIGQPVVIKEKLFLPVVVRDRDRVSVVELRNIRSDSANSIEFFEASGVSTIPKVLYDIAIADPPYGLEVELKDAWPDIEGVRWIGDKWLIPGRSSQPDSWELWSANGDENVLWASKRLLSDFIGEHGAASFGKNLSPVGVDVVVLSDDAVLLWYDTDTIWLVGPTGARVLFHPAAGINIDRVNENQVLLWVSNASKGYLIDITKIPHREN